MYELKQLTEQQLPAALTAIIHEEIVEMLDIPHVLKYPGLPYVIHQPGTVFEGDFMPEPEYAYKSFLPFLLFEHKQFDAYQTECLCFMVLGANTSEEFFVVQQRLMELDVYDAAAWHMMETSEQIIDTLHTWLHDFDGEEYEEHRAIPFYNAFADVLDIIFGAYGCYFETLLDQHLRLTYLGVEFMRNDCRNSVAYFVDAYDLQLESAQKESEPHTTYLEVYRDYKTKYSRDEEDSSVFLKNPIRGGGFSCMT